MKLANKSSVRNPFKASDGIGIVITILKVIGYIILAVGVLCCIIGLANHTSKISLLGLAYMVSSVFVFIGVILVRGLQRIVCASEFVIYDMERKYDIQSPHLK